jgi:hypothetical protein
MGNLNDLSYLILHSLTIIIFSPFLFTRLLRTFGPMEFRHQNFGSENSDCPILTRTLNICVSQIRPRL